MTHDNEHDDGRPWGHITSDGVWHELPKQPMLLAQLGPPPFQVTLPTGQVRLVVHRSGKDDEAV
jgi:hypothetical protein